MKRSRAQKEHIVSTLHQTLQESDAVFVTQQTGLTVAEISVLRRNLYEIGAGFRVTKNRLALLALEGSGCENLRSHFSGSSAVAFSSKDPVAMAKAVCDFAKAHTNFQLVAGQVDAEILDKTQIEHLASLPSLDTLHAKIIGLMQAPAGKLARLLQTPASQLVQVTGEWGKK